MFLPPSGDFLTFSSALRVFRKYLFICSRLLEGTSCLVCVMFFDMALPFGCVSVFCVEWSFCRFSVTFLEHVLVACRYLFATVFKCGFGCCVYPHHLQAEGLRGVLSHDFLWNLC